MLCFFVGAAVCIFLPRHEVVFFPLCLGTYPATETGDFFIFIMLVMLSVFFEFVKWLVPVLLIARGSMGYYSIDHMVLLLGSLVFVLWNQRIWLLCVWLLYIFALRFFSRFYRNKKPLTNVQYF